MTWRALNSNVISKRCLASVENLTHEAIKAFTAVLGSQKVKSSNAVREQHDHDESFHKGQKPIAVLMPSKVDEVSEIVKICNRYKMNIIPFGTGSGLEGGVVPLDNKSVCINLLGLESIKEISTDDLCCTVEPGITRTALNEALKSTGLWFPIDPGADASVCGMAATNASGTNAVRYGTMKQNVLNMEVVLPNGDVLYTSGKGQKCLKRSSGYNLTELFVGSEGTLGIITSVTTKLHGIPECVLSAVCPFPCIDSAVKTSMQIKQCGIPIARMEVIDKNTLKLVKEQSNLDLITSDSLFFEFHGSEQSTKEEVELVKEISNSNGAGEMKWSEKLEERNKLWKARHDVFYAAKRLKPGYNIIITDVCVPISQLSSIISFTKDLLTKAGILYLLLGHIGDGNFHALLIVDPDNEKEVEKGKDAAYKMALQAIKLGGSCTGEHGVGIGKKNLLEHECGEVGLSLMRNLKSVVDPFNIMNPGKLV